MNRTRELDACLSALWSSSVKPYSVVVSDNSPESEIQEKNRYVVSQYPGTIYLEGPHSGVTSNRNNAFSAVTPETDLVAFLCDDICVNPDFIARAVDRYTQMSPEERNCTIISGESTDGFKDSVGGPLGFSFRGYFYRSDVPHVVHLPAAVFPRSFFEEEAWDENIFIGQEDAELCLRALKRGYRMLYCPELRVLDICPNRGSLPKVKISGLVEYKIYSEASRLYVGIKRYKYISLNMFKLWLFIGVYFVQMTYFLSKKGALSAFPEILRRSNIQKL